MASSGHYPDRSGTAKGVNIAGTLVMTFFAVWRLIVRFGINPRLGWSDYWIILALATALAGHTFFLISAFSGEGLVDADPSLTFAVKNKIYFLQHFGGALNMYAMFLAKLSICTYLLGLNFSRTYRRIITASIALICVCNFGLPMLSHWAACTPVSARWDRSIRPADKKCWPMRVHVYIAFIQAGTNVLTDVLYAAAPLVYLRHANLSKYTQWGVRLVFLAALIGTGISIAKPIHLAQLYTNFYGIHNDVYISVTTTSLSTAENSVCITVACLPPLRRAIDDAIRRLLPETWLQRIGAVDGAVRGRLETLSTGGSEGSAAWTGSVESVESGWEAKGLGEEFVQDGTGRIVCVKAAVVVSRDEGQR